jgi:hypothetical protein
MFSVFVFSASYKDNCDLFSTFHSATKIVGISMRFEKLCVLEMNFRVKF